MIAAVVVVLDLARLIMNSLGTATAQFGFDLFQELNKTKEGNIFFSPVSITTAIGMLFLGARGATAAQLQEVGGLSLFARRGLVSGGSLFASPRTDASLDLWGRKQRERVKTRRSLNSTRDVPFPLHIPPCHLLPGAWCSFG